MRELALSKVYQLLEPGPVVLLSTAHHDRANVMTMSWHMMVNPDWQAVAVKAKAAIEKARGAEAARRDGPSRPNCIYERL